MADDSVQVKIGADVSAAKSGMEDGAASIKASLDGIKSALENFGGQNQKITQQAIQNNADLSRSFLELKGSATGGFNAIAGVIERVRGVLATLTAALAGGLIGKEGVSSLISFRDIVHGLQLEFGLTADKATLLATQLRLSGVSAEAYEQMGQRVARMLKTQGEEFDRLGVKTKDSAGDFLPMDQILQNVYQRMLDFKPGTDQLEFALTMVGRNAKDFAADMEALNAVSQRAKDIQQQLGIEMGPARQAEVQRYKVEFNAFKLTLDEISIRIGEALLPGLERLAEWFNSVGPTAIKVITVAMQLFISTMEVLKVTLDGLYTAFKILGLTIYEVGLALTGQESIKEAWANIRQGAQDAINDIVRRTQEGADRINAIWAGTQSGQQGMHDRGIGSEGAIPGSGKQSFTPKPTGGDDRLAQFKAQLDDMNLAQGAFNQLSKQQEADFWTEKLALISGNGKKEIALRAEINREILRARNAAAREELADDVATLHAQEVADKNNKDAQIADAVALTALLKSLGQNYVKEYQRALAEETAIREAWAKKEQAIAKEIANIDQKMTDETVKYSIEMNKLAEDQKVALGLESNAQRLSNERAFVEQQYKVDLDGINARLAAEQQGTVAYEKLLAEKLKMEQAYQKQVTQIANQAELDREKYAIEAEKAIVSSITDIFANLITNAKNWKQTLLDGFKALDDQLVKIAANQLVQQYLGASTAGGNWLSGLTSKIFGGGTGGAGGASQSAATTANTTAVSANTAAQTTGTATVTLLNTAETLLTTALTSLTAAVTANTAALAGSSASGFGSGITGAMLDAGGTLGDFASFDVGSAYVPHDMLAMIHKGEAVIPAAYNTGGGGGNVNQRNTFVFSGPVDTRTQTQIALQVQRASQMAMRRSR